MSLPLLCLLGFTTWAILLVSGIAVWRTVDVLAGRKRANEFPSGLQHGGDLYWRLNRAQINTAENLPIFGTLVLAGTLLQVATPTFSLLAQVVLAARLVQSMAHIASGSSAAVNVRFTAFATQLVCFVWMLVEILRVARLV